MGFIFTSYSIATETVNIHCFPLPLYFYILLLHYQFHTNYYLFSSLNNVFKHIFIFPITLTLLPLLSFFTNNSRTWLFVSFFIMICLYLRCSSVVFHILFHASMYIWYHQTFCKQTLDILSHLYNFRVTLPWNQHYNSGHGFYRCRF